MKNNMQGKLGYWPSEFTETYTTDGEVMFGIEAEPEVFEAINCWLRAKHMLQPFGYVINLTGGGKRGTYVKMYEFYGVSPVTVGLRLALSAPTLIKDENITANRRQRIINKYLAYCEDLIEVCELTQLPTFGIGRDGQPVYQELVEWAEEFGIKVYNLHLFAKFPQPPSSGRILFVWYEKQNEQETLTGMKPAQFLLPIIMFFEKSDAMLFKLSFQ